MPDTSKDIARTLARRYGTLAPNQLQQLAALITPLRVRKGDLLLKAGDTCRHIYYVSKGLLRHFHRHEGKELTEHIVYDGALIICSESLFSETPSPFTIEALEPSSLFSLPYADFTLLTQSAYSLCHIYISMLQESLVSARQEAEMRRIDSAQERYGHLLHHHPDIIRRTPLHIVASYLHMRPETLSRVRTAMADTPL